MIEALHALRPGAPDEPPQSIVKQTLERVFSEHTPSDAKAKAFYTQAVKEVFRELEL